MPLRLRLLASGMLVALLGGGVLSPAVHEWHHAGEAEQTLHEALGHEAESGVALGLPCVEETETEWACVLCAGLSAHLAAQQTALVVPDLADRVAEAGVRAAAEDALRALRNRGPPAA